ncbi:RecX family transcriptional regulator [Candidatus Saccharibacteria bacterium]|nr:RecX family transcriptional regulator [Candidatus Saccharibacteria bacterium]
MEIISLNTAEKSRQAHNFSVEPDSSHSITAIKPATRDENRVNIFIDEEFAFSLDLAQVVDFKLKVGKTLDEPEIKKLKKASNFGKLYQRTLEWVLSRPRSVRETRDYLKKKQFEKPEYGITDEDIAAVIDRLIKKTYLDDQKFAEYYLENRFQKKGISKKRLKLELQRKGLSPEVIEQAFQSSSRDDAEEIKKIIARKRARYDDEQLMSYLTRQGFSYDLVKSILDQN